MGRERRLGTIEVLGDLPCCHRPLLQELKDASPGRIGKCLKHKVHYSIIS